MMSAGRRPSYDSAGRVRGFRSAPGAPMSERDTIRGIPNNPAGGLSNAEDWGRFFKGNSPTGVRMGYTATNPAIAAAAYPTVTATTAASPLPTTNLFARPVSSQLGGIQTANASIFMDRFKRPATPSPIAQPSGGGGYLDRVIQSAVEFLGPSFSIYQQPKRVNQWRGHV